MSDEKKEAFQRILDAYISIMEEHERLVYQACTGAEQGEGIYLRIMEVTSELTQACSMITVTRAQSAEFNDLCEEWEDKQANPQEKRFYQH